MNDLIQWPTAKYWTAQWNPVIGCKPCSPACEHCYAAAWAKRFGQSFEPHKSSQERPPRKGVVFCGNMTDLFGEWAMMSTRYLDPIEEWLSETFYYGRSMRYMKQCTYLWLTKRVGNMVKVLQKGKIDIDRQVSRFSEMVDWGRFDFGKDLMSNNYFGFTAENQEWYDRRMKDFRGGMPRWANGWLSAEPLLGPINLGLQYIAPEDAPFKWVVVGCESGPNRRPCKIEWVADIVEQCRAANVPVFVKQICLPNGKFTNKIEEFPEHLRIRQVPWAKEGAK